MLTPAYIRLALANRYVNYFFEKNYKQLQKCSLSTAAPNYFSAIDPRLQPFALFAGIHNKEQMSATTAQTLPKEDSL